MRDIRFVAGRDDRVRLEHDEHARPIGRKRARELRRSRAQMRGERARFALAAGDLAHACERREKLIVGFVVDQFHPHAGSRDVGDEPCLRRNPDDDVGV